MTWYSRTVGDDSVLRVANRAGLVHSTLNRQLKAEKLAPETLVAVADAYGRDALKALIIHGLINEGHVRRYARTMSLTSFSDREVADEVARRLVGVDEHPVFDEPIRLTTPPEGIELMAAHDPGYSPEDEQEQTREP